VVHGDIKPSNIQIGANGEVRLLDFGIAKMITFTQNLTRHNLGSPTYCSPERLAKAQVDAQSDLWALAVSLYEMVAGMPPYQAVSTRKLETLIQSRRPPRALPESCPPRLRAILFKALAADIHRRYASTVEFAADLRAFLENRRTVAEDENLPSWDANETIQTTPPQNLSATKLATLRLAKLRRTAFIGNSRMVAAALFFGLICGHGADAGLSVPRRDAASSRRLQRNRALRRSMRTGSYISGSSGRTVSWAGFRRQLGWHNRCARIFWLRPLQYLTPGATAPIPR